MVPSAWQVPTSQTPSGKAGVQHKPYCLHQQFRGSEPLIPVHGGNSAKIQVPRCQPRADLASSGPSQGSGQAGSADSSLHKGLVGREKDFRAWEGEDGSGGWGMPGSSFIPHPVVIETLGMTETPENVNASVMLPWAQPGPGSSH